PHGYTKLRSGAAIDASARFQTLPPLEFDHGRTRSLVKDTRDLDREPAFDQNVLHLTDFIRAEVDNDLAAATARRRTTPPSRTNRHHRDDATAVVEDDDVIPHHEVAVVAELRTNLHDRRRDRNDPHIVRDNGANRHVEVDIAYPRNVRTGQHGVTNAGTLLD